MRLALLVLLAANWGPGSVDVCDPDGSCVTCVTGKWGRCTRSYYDVEPEDWISPPTLGAWLKRGVRRATTVYLSNACPLGASGEHCEPETCGHLKQSTWWCL